MIIDDTENETMSEEEQVETKPKKKRAAKKAGKEKKAAKAKGAGKVKRASGNGNGRMQKLNEDRKDVYAALLRIRADGPRGSIIERLAKNSGKMFTADQIAKWVDWDKRKVQNLMTVRVPYKLTKYSDAAKRIKLLAEGDGSYGLEVK